MGARHEAKATGGPPLGGHDRLLVAHPHHRRDQADGDLQPGRTKPCQGELRRAGIYCRDRRCRRTAPARSRPYLRTGEDVPHLPGVHLRALRTGAGGASARDHAFLSAKPLWCGEALRLLDREELPRVLRALLLQRHPLQPRERAARRKLRDAQDFPRRRRRAGRQGGRHHPPEHREERPERRRRTGRL